jgi:hypothetical protein
MRGGPPVTSEVRLRFSGDAAERALFGQAAAEVVTVPDDLRRRVRARVEERLGQRRRPWLALALAATLLAGSALALGLTGARRPMPPPATRPAAHPRAVVIAAPPRPPVVARSTVPRGPAPARSAPRPSPPPPPGQIRDFPVEEDIDPLVSPPAPRLVISREGRGDVSLVLAGGRVVGQVRGRPLALTIEGSRLTGKLGDHNVWLWLHGHEAGGEIGGIPVRFQLVDTGDGHQLREGYSVRSTLSTSADRLALSPRALRWLACDAPLPAVQPGVYEGACRSGRRARVVVPPAWSALPPLARTILLSFVLTERDPALGPLFEPRGQP